jgi:hypothetical protein
MLTTTPDGKCSKCGRPVYPRADRIVQASRGASAEYIADENAPTSREQYFGPRDTWVNDVGDIG